ncbi:MAG: VCBS repeat-containing protein [Myxococcota bacterium]
MQRLTASCDDGNDVDGDGCEADCTSPSCGNGAVDEGEFCHQFSEEFVVLGGGLGAPRAVDIDDDGSTDVVTVGSFASALHVMFGDSQGALAADPAVPLPDAPIQVVVADFNDDDVDDLGTVHVDETLQVRYGAGDGAFGDVATTTPFPTYGFKMRGIDIDGDGRIDVAAPSADLQTIMIRRSVGDGTFTSHDFPVANLTADFAVGDFDGDGVFDLATTGSTSTTTSDLVLFSGNGDGSYTAQPAVAIDTEFWFTMIAADMNDDGDLDIVGAAPSDGIVLALGDGAGQFDVLPPQPLDSLLPLHVELGNLNADPYPDLVISFDESVRVTVALGNEDLEFSQQFFNFGDVAGIALADFNQDSIDDVAVAGKQWGDDKVRLLLSTP